MADNVLNPSGIPSNVATKDILNSHHQRIINHDDVGIVKLKFNLDNNYSYDEGALLGSEKIIDNFFRSSNLTTSTINSINIRFNGINKRPCYLLVYSDQMSSFSTSLTNGANVSSIRKSDIVLIQNQIVLDDDFKYRNGLIANVQSTDRFIKHKLYGNSSNLSLRCRLVSMVKFKTFNTNSSITIDVIWTKD